MSAENFDMRADAFSALLRQAANWKHNFLGAAYSTRIASAVLLAESACREARRLLAEDGAAIPEPLSRVASEDATNVAAEVLGMPPSQGFKKEGEV